MFDQLTNRLGPLATRRNVLILLALEILMNAVVLPIAGARIQAFSGGVGPLDLRFAYTADQAFAALTAYGPTGREFYLLIELTADVLYPIIYSLFFSLAILFFWERAGGRWPILARLALLPFVGLIADYLENAGLITLLLNYPAQLPTLALLTSLFTSIKWIMAGLSLVALTLSLVAAVITRLQKPDPAQP